MTYFVLSSLQRSWNWIRLSGSHNRVLNIEISKPAEVLSDKRYSRFKWSILHLIAKSPFLDFPYKIGISDSGCLNGLDARINPFKISFKSTESEAS